MGEVTILKDDADILRCLGSGFPYEQWLKNKKYNDSIHHSALYVLTYDNWNAGFTNWVNRNEEWLVRVANGDSIKVIQKTITITTINYDRAETATISDRPLKYEGGDTD